MTDHHHHSIMPTTTMATASSSSTQSQSARFVTDIITPLKDRVALLPGSRDRQKHPIIFFPTTDISANSDELKNILFYFYSVTADDAKPHGFIFIIGSKKGASRQTVKPSSILHLINEYFPGKVIAVYIIVKGNNFFKTSSTSGKYKFHVQEITDEKTLTKFIDSSQLLKEFGGNLHYDHDEWIEIRKDIEFVIQKLSGCLKECEICYKLLQKKKFIEDNGQDWPLNSQDEFDRRLNSISTIDCDNDIRRIHQQILNTADDRYNLNTVKTPNPDLAFVIPFLQKLAKNIAKERADLTGNYQRSKLEQDQWNQFRLLENEVIELKNRIINQKVSIDETFTVIGNNESDAQQLLKEHQRFEDSVEQTKVNYTHLLKHGSILINNFPAKKSEIDAILKDLENSWNYLTALIDQRLKLLDIVISFRQQTEIYFSKLPEWMNFIKAQPDNLNRPLTELEEIAKGQEEVENDIELSYSRSYDESMKLSQRLVMYLGQERAGKDESYRHVLEIIQKLTRSRREMHSLYEDKKIRLAMKMSYTAFIEESASVINWIDAHGLPHMKKKTTIGRSTPEIKNLHQHHHKFKSVAENTRKNAYQLYQVAEKLAENANGETEVVKDRLQQLSNVVQNFFNLMEHRESLLTQSAMFHLHYNEITGWYDNIKDRSATYEIIPPNQKECEDLQEQLIKENEATLQAYSTVMEESDKLIRMLKEQKGLLDVDVSKDEAHIEEMTNYIQTKHNGEMERWPYQRNCVQVGYRSRQFITDCTTICKQIVEWRKDLVPLQPPQRHERILYEFLKCTDENIKQIEDVLKDFAQQYSNLLHMIETNQLNLIDSTKNQPINEVLTQRFQQLNHIVDETLMRANSLKQELSINRDIRETYARTDALINQIREETYSLNKLLVRIPETKDEAKRLGYKLDEMKSRMENMCPLFDEMKETFRFLAMNTNDHQRKNILDTNNTLLSSWESYIAKINDCNKFISHATAFHNMNEGLTPVIEQYLNIKHPNDYCHNSKTPDLVSYLSTLQTKHASEKEKFLKISIHSRKIYDDFIKTVQKCPMKREYRILKERDIRQQMEFNERRQKEVLKLLNDRTKYIEQCQRAVFVRKMAEDVQNWLKSDTNVRNFYENFKNLRSLSDEILQEKHADFLDFKNKAKKKQHEVKEINRHAELYHNDGINIVHSKEVQECQHTVTECFKTFWRHVEDMDKQFKNLLGGTIERISPSEDSGVNDVTERFSDSTLEEKIQQTEDQKADNKMRKPMNLLIQGEKDGIDYLRVIIDMYLPEYRKANKDGTVPPSLIGKEKEIFGNIEELYQFHQHFVKELELYKNNPTDVGCAFVNNIQRLRDIYCEYTINKEQNGAIHHEDVTVKFFQHILHKFSGNNNKPFNSHLDFDYYKEKNFNVNFDSVIMWPVQRLFKYSMLLKELIEFAPYEIKEIKEVKEDIDGITSYANGIVKLADIEDFTVTSDDIFCMADEFIVTEPKRVFKSEKKYQVFLFETSILLTKKIDKTEKNSVKYLFKDQIMLNDVFVVEHVDSSKIKFGLRKRNAVSSSDNTTIFKSSNEKTQKQWVKKLREFTVTIQPNQDTNLSKKSSTTTLGNENHYRSFRSPHTYSSSRPSSSTTDPSSNRNSRSSRDSYEISQSSTSNGHLTVPDINGSSEDNGNSRTKDGHVGFRLSQWPNE